MRSNNRVSERCGANGQFVTARMAAAAVLDAERICDFHAGIVRDYCRRQVEVARRTSAAASVDDYMAIQQELVQMHFDSLLSYVSKWNGLATEGSRLVEAVVEG